MNFFKTQPHARAANLVEVTAISQQSQTENGWQSRCLPLRWLTAGFWASKWPAVRCSTFENVGSQVFQLRNGWQSRFAPLKWLAFGFSSFETVGSRFCHLQNGWR